MASKKEKEREDLEHLHLTKNTLDKLSNDEICFVFDALPSNNLGMYLKIAVKPHPRNAELYVTIKKTFEALGIVFEEVKADPAPFLVIKAQHNNTKLRNPEFQVILENTFLDLKKQQENSLKLAISSGHLKNQSKVNITRPAVPQVKKIINNEDIDDYKVFFSQIMHQGNDAVTVKNNEVRVEYPDNYENSYIHVSALEKTLMDLAVPHEMKSHGISNFVAIIPTLQMDLILKDQSKVVAFVNEYKKQIRHFTRQFSGQPPLEGFPNYQAKHPLIKLALNEMETANNQMPGSVLDNHAFYFSYYAEKLEEVDKDFAQNEQDKVGELRKILKEMKELASKDALTAKKFGEKLSEDPRFAPLSPRRNNTPPPVPSRNMSPAPLLKLSTGEGVASLQAVKKSQRTPPITPPPSPRTKMAVQRNTEVKGPGLKAYDQVKEELLQKLQMKQQTPKPKGEEEGAKSPRKKS